MSYHYSKYEFLGPESDLERYRYNSTTCSVHSFRSSSSSSLRYVFGPFSGTGLDVPRLANPRGRAPAARAKMQSLRARTDPRTTDGSLGTSGSHSRPLVARRWIRAGTHAASDVFGLLAWTFLRCLRPSAGRQLDIGGTGGATPGSQRQRRTARGGGSPRRSSSAMAPFCSSSLHCMKEQRQVINPIELR
jgi:hypothetical protein